MISKKNYKLLDKLVCLRTTLNKQKNQKRAIKLIRENLPVLFESTRFYKNGYFLELFYPIGAKKSLDIILVAHVDVVDGKQEFFRVVAKKNKLFGRGVFDMKGPLIAMIDAVGKFYQKGKKNISIGLLVTSDEEQGGFNGTGFILNKNIFNTKVAIIPDGGENLNNLIVEEKGVLEVELSYKGISAHVSKPWNGKNSAEELNRIIYKILNHFPAGNEKQWKTIATLTYIKSDFIANNTTPSFAKARVVFRYIEKDSRKKILNFIKSLDKELNIKILAQGDALKVSANNNFLKIYRSSVKLKTGKKCLTARYYSACDARFFASKGIPVIINRPMGGNAHKDDEWISANSLNLFSEILTDFFEKLEEQKK